MATQVTVRIVNGFVTPGRAGTPAHGGNPAGVVLDADDLSEADMQSVAAAVGHSETAFVSASETADFRFDFFHADAADRALWPRHNCCLRISRGDWPAQ